MVNCVHLILMYSVCAILMHTCGICRTVVNCNTNIIALKIFNFITPAGSGVEATPYGKLCMLASNA